MYIFDDAKGITFYTSFRIEYVIDQHAVKSR